MKIDGLVINQSKSVFKDGCAYLLIQNEAGRKIGVLNLQSIGLSEHFKMMKMMNRKIKLNLEVEKNVSEEVVGPGN